MKRFALCLMLFLFIVASAFGTVLFPKTLTRGVDPVIVKGEVLSPLHGLAISNLRLCAYRDGEMKPIPFQIDQRGKDGDYVFPLGKKENAKDDDGLLDANDELVFMAADAGAGAPLPFWTKGFQKGQQIELTDPVDGGVGNVYLLYFESPPAASSVDYVNYIAETNSIDAKNYSMAFHPKASIGIGDLAVKPAGGGMGIDLVDRLKIRFVSKTVFGFGIDKNEEEFTSKTIAWIDGPVRVVRRTSNRMVLFWNIPSPSAELDNVYYADSFEFPTRVDLPFDSDLVLREPVFRVSTDLYCNSASGNVFRNEHNPDGVVIDGVMSDAEKNMDKSRYNWSCMNGGREDNKGGWLNRLLYPTIDTPVHPTLYYMDDAKLNDSPEDEKGVCGDIGYYLEGIDKVKKGRFELVSVMYNFREYSPEMVQNMLNVLDQPLQVKAGPAKTPTMLPPAGTPIP